MSLEVCSSDHEEIVFHEYVNSRRVKCPLCEALERAAEIADKLNAIPDIEPEEGDTPEQVADFANNHWRNAIKEILP